ncbi:AbrB/MazE/SpoVT family DNA-binding domain-containing protein [candidate division KSB1 bacterium]|nr:AbrB/MazE/SpoVT family DNA-binding domain-containing protein [candidate division KSB1 bacterium]RQW04444.1 MAG: AbrB/MazE/SpoVT family DNA-binding domain-containing protein [candidate division KSB1 bacterium]
MAIATVTSKGQVTLPLVIRELLNIEPGDRVDFSYDKELNKVILTPRNKKNDQVRGLLSHYAKDKPVTDDEMRDAIGKYIAEKFK